MTQRMFNGLYFLSNWAQTPFPYTHRHADTFHAPVLILSVLSSGVLSEITFEKNLLLLRKYCNANDLVQICHLVDRDI